MTEQLSGLSQVFHSEEFDRRLDQWNQRVQDYSEQEEEFWDTTNKELDESFPYAQDIDSDDSMTLELIADSISHAASIKELRSSHAATLWGYPDGFEERFAQKIVRDQSHLISRRVAIDLLVDHPLNQFEQYGLEAHVPVSEPVSSDELRQRIAISAGNLLQLDTFVRQNEGQIFLAQNIYASIMGRFGGSGIKITGSSTAIPVIPGTGALAYPTTDPAKDGMAFHASDVFTERTASLDRPLSVVPVGDHLGADLDFIASKSYVTWSIGTLVEGPLNFHQPVGSKFYQENLEYYERHVRAIRELGWRASSHNS